MKAVNKQQWLNITKYCNQPTKHITFSNQCDKEKIKIKVKRAAREYKLVWKRTGERGCLSLLGQLEYPARSRVKSWSKERLLSLLPTHQYLGGLASCARVCILTMPWVCTLCADRAEGAGEQGRYVLAIDFIMLQGYSLTSASFNLSSLKAQHPHQGHDP